MLRCSTRSRPCTRPGATLAFGSDWSVSTANPLEEMEVAIRRADPADRDADPFLPDQRLPLPLALAAFTKGSSHVNHDDDAGSIEEGNRADLVVLDRNLFDARGRHRGRRPGRAHDRRRPGRLLARLRALVAQNAAASSDSHGRAELKGGAAGVLSEEGSVAAGRRHEAIRRRRRGRRHLPPGPAGGVPLAPRARPAAARPPPCGCWPASRSPPRATSSSRARPSRAPRPTSGT